MCFCFSCVWLIVACWNEPLGTLCFLHILLEPSWAWQSDHMNSLAKSPLAHAPSLYLFNHDHRYVSVSPLMKTSYCKILQYLQTTEFSLPVYRSTTWSDGQRLSFSNFHHNKPQKKTWFPMSPYPGAKTKTKKNRNNSPPWWCSWDSRRKSWWLDVQDQGSRPARFHRIFFSVQSSCQPCTLLRKIFDFLRICEDATC